MYFCVFVFTQIIPYECHLTHSFSVVLVYVVYTAKGSCVDVLCLNKTRDKTKRLKEIDMHVVDLHALGTIAIPYQHR